MAALITGRESEAKKPAKRYTNCDVMVSARTIGTKIHFKMPVLNVSATGMLLSWSEVEKVPFNVNTILELDINSADAPHLKTVQCLAKVIHTAIQDGGTRRFGVKIIQTEDEEKSQWTSMIQILEDKGIDETI